MPPLLPRRRNTKEGTDRQTKWRCFIWYACECCVAKNSSVGLRNGKQLLLQRKLQLLPLCGCTIMGSWEFTNLDFKFYAWYKNSRFRYKAFVYGTNHDIHNLSLLNSISPFFLFFSPIYLSEGALLFSSAHETAIARGTSQSTSCQGCQMNSNFRSSDNFVLEQEIKTAANAV
jgi:hypothetical protein